MAEEGLDRARLSSNATMLLWAQSALASARLAAGDVQEALQHAMDAVDSGAPPGFHAAGQPGWCLGAALTAAGNPEQAVPAMRDAFGGNVLADLAKKNMALFGEAGRTLTGAAKATEDKKLRDDEVELMAEMTLAARRPLNWNVLTVDAKEPERYRDVALDPIASVRALDASSPDELLASIARELRAES